MRGKTKEQIMSDRNALVERVKQCYPDAEIIDSVLDISSEHNDIYYLGESIKLMSQADLVIFMGGWEKARGCVIEHDICKRYNIKLKEEYFFDPIHGVVWNDECVRSICNELYSEYHGI